MNTDDTDPQGPAGQSGADALANDMVSAPPVSGSDDLLPLDPVEAALAAYLEFLGGAATRPELGDLSDDDRREAVRLINAVLAARGTDVGTSTPAFEELLVGTEFESALRAYQAAATPPEAPPAAISAAAVPRAGFGADRRRARMERIAAALGNVDDRVAIRTEPHEVVGTAVAVSYLDLRAIFFPIDAEEALITDDVRADVARLFTDAGLAYVGVVADHSTDLPTQLLIPSDLATVVVAPSDELTVPWLPVLTLPDALRRMLETAAPTWEPYRLNVNLQEPLDIAALAARVSRTVIEAETARAYRGDKKAAYQALTGSTEAFTRLVQELNGAGEVDDGKADAAVDAIVREAA
jgi:hypothetical protein